MWKEADVKINGLSLAFGEIMSVRVAISQFLIQLQADGLGDDEMGKSLCNGYQRACKSVLSKMAHKGDHTPDRF